MSTSPITLIFGAGERVGEAATAAFLSAGYRVARISRSQVPSKDTPTLLNIPGDLAQTETVERVFATVRERWGEPSVVIYNAYGAHSTDVTNPSNTFNIPTPAFAAAQTINLISSFAAMREALTSFRSPSAPSGPKTFILTGNTFNQGTFPGFLALGAGKAGAAWMVECADSIVNPASPYFSLEEGQDIRFFYADERKADGTPLFTGLGAKGHAEAFLGLAERREGWKGVGWLVTFVCGDEKEGGKTRVKEFAKGLILPKGRELKGREDLKDWIGWVLTQ